MICSTGHGARTSQAHQNPALKCRGKCGAGSLRYRLPINLVLHTNEFNVRYLPAVPESCHSALGPAAGRNLKADIRTLGVMESLRQKRTSARTSAWAVGCSSLGRLAGRSASPFVICAAWPSEPDTSNTPLTARPSRCTRSAPQWGRLLPCWR